MKDLREERAREFLERVLEDLSIGAEVSLSQEEDHIGVKIEGENLGFLIGRGGQTLDALECLVNIVANKDAAERKRVVVDIQDYRQRRRDFLEDLARRTAEKVEKKGTSLALQPMKASERRLIHLALKDDSQVETESDGEEPYRKVIIKPRNSSKSQSEIVE